VKKLLKSINKFFKKLAKEKNIEIFKISAATGDKNG